MSNELIVLVASIAGGVVGLGLYIWTSLALQSLFRAHKRPGGLAWLPIANSVVLLQIGGFSGWWVLANLVPGLGTIAVVVLILIACRRIDRSAGGGAGLVVLAIFVFPLWATLAARRTWRKRRADEAEAERQAADEAAARRNAPPEMPSFAAAAPPPAYWRAPDAHTPTPTRAPAPTRTPAPTPAPEVAPAADVPASIRWELTDASDAVVAELVGTSAVLGRDPRDVADDGGAQRVRVDDETRSVSKTHARIEYRGEQWWIIDVGSSNGVRVLAPGGAVHDVPQGARAPLSPRFYLGDVELRLRAIR